MMQNRIFESVALLVASCDEYSDLWPPFFHLFNRFWPNCPFDIYLLSNTISYDSDKVRPVLISPDVSWSQTLRGALRQLDEKYVFLFLDDLMLCKDVDQGKIEAIFDWIIKHEARYVRLNPTPPPDKALDGFFGIIEKGSIYRASSVLSVWKREVLVDLLVDGESAWDFEVHGSIRSDAYGRFYAAVHHNVPVINAVVKGKWRRSAVRKMESLGVIVDLRKRSPMSPREEMEYFLRRQRRRLFALLPGRKRRRIKEILLRGNYNYNKG